MKITAVNAKQPSKPQFKAVNQKYFEWAKKDYSLEKNVSCDWLQRLSFDVFLFKEISPQDGIDTVNAVKKYMKKTDNAIEDLLNSFRKANR
ncbi:TPA: hypothetical protein CPT98_01375 [Candidatus Gastranaerophilales bacterium HUM_19]|jgi:hypothetical protein|nr:MAG TPA: hypothetical protein CPT97_04150 [Candidatus Gastranaerophilales bacterium HUM_17]DAB19274.1 MAG TPA: hypothetical protein CPT98_01375 [Candidatus Gastranaerophilales bacterium HUM_19]